MFIKRFEEKLPRDPDQAFRKELRPIFSDRRQDTTDLNLNPLCWTVKNIDWDAESLFFRTYKNQFGHEDAQFISCRPQKKIAKNWFYWALYDYIQFHIKNKTYNKCMYAIDPFNKTIQMTFLDFNILMSTMSVPIDELYGSYGCSEEFALLTNNKEFIKSTKLYSKYPKAVISPFFDFKRTINLVAQGKIDGKDFMYSAYSTIFRQTGIKTRDSHGVYGSKGEVYGSLLPDVRYSLFNVDIESNKTPVMKNQQEIFDFVNKKHKDVTEKQIEFITYLRTKRPNIKTKEQTPKDIDRIANKVYKQALDILAKDKKVPASELTPAMTRFSKKKCVNYVMYWGLISCTQYYHGRPLEINAKKERNQFGPHYNYLRKALVSLGLLECKDSSYAPGFKCKVYFTSLFKDQADTISKNWDRTKENHWIGGKNEVVHIYKNMDPDLFQKSTAKVISAKLHKKFKVSKSIDVLFLNEQLDQFYAGKDTVGYKKSYNKHPELSKSEIGIRYCLDKINAIKAELDFKRIKDLQGANIKSYHYINFKQRYDRKGEWNKPHHKARLKAVKDSITQNYLFVRRKIDYLKEHERKYSHFSK